MQSRVRRTLLLTLLAIIVAGCKQGGVRETLDEQSLVSIITITPPYTFYRLRLEDDIEREFVLMGPIDRIRSAERGQYLWLNLWAVKRDGSHTDAILPDSIEIETSGGRVALTRTADRHADLDVSKSPYNVVRKGVGEGYYALDDTQLDALRDVPLVALHLNGHRYELWGDQSQANEALSQFLLETTGY